jgi:4,5-DOPA dioxygenase extradiol
MPVLFVGHGSPMNIIADNSYTRSMQELGRILPSPSVVLVVSAHWQTRGTYVTSAAEPPTIYDFYGFPPALYREKYQAPGSPAIAERVRQVSQNRILPDGTRGIDHAAWAVLKHMYPAAEIPVLEMSLDVNLSAAEHYALGQTLAPLRQEGVLIIGSGNLVHNLSRIDFDSMYGKKYDWAERFDKLMEELLLEREHGQLIEFDALPDNRLAIPTDEHYLPMLYAVALQEAAEELHFCCSDIQNGSISMRSFVIGG